MPDATYIACPRCGEPYAMTSMQKRLFHGRTLTCQRCAKPFMVTEETPEPVPAPAVRPWTAAPASSVAPTPAQPIPQELPAKAGEGISAKRMSMFIAIGTVVLGVLLWLAISPSVHRSREVARRATCGSNLTQIGLALQMYANTNGGSYPPTLDVLVANGSLPPELLVCPSTRDTPAPGESALAQAKNLATGKHLSYAYVGKGLSFVSGRQVLAYEPLEHHDGEGANVLFTDASVQFVPKSAISATVPGFGMPGAPVPAAPVIVSPPTAAPSTTRPKGLLPNPEGAIGQFDGRT